MLSIKTPSDEVGKVGSLGCSNRQDLQARRWELDISPVGTKVLDAKTPR